AARRQVRQLPVLGHRGHPGPRCRRGTAHGRGAACRAGGRVHPPDRQDSRPQPGHAGAVPEVWLRGYASHDGVAARPAPRRPRGGRPVTSAPTPRPGKCGGWGLDTPLREGVYRESAAAPPATPAMATALADLGSRGILHAIASKNPPQAAEHAAAVTGARFAAVECGWGAKSDALARIAADLSIGTDALAFVDDDPYERAEVGAALPE